MIDPEGRIATDGNVSIYVDGAVRHVFGGTFIGDIEGGTINQNVKVVINCAVGSGVLTDIAAATSPMVSDSHLRNKMLGSAVSASASCAVRAPRQSSSKELPLPPLQSSYKGRPLPLLPSNRKIASGASYNRPLPMTRKP